MIKPENDLFKITFLTFASAVLIGGYVFWKQKSKKSRASQEPIPNTWRRVGEVSSITMYPLKSGKSHILNSAECTKVGLREENNIGKHTLLDRSFVVFNEKTKDKVTIREFPKMYFIDVKVDDEDTVVFTNPDSEDLVVKIPTSQNENSNNNFVIMWNKEIIPTIDCGDEASDWFTKVIVTRGDTRCRLGYYAPDVLHDRSLATSTYGEDHTEIYPKMDDDYMGRYSDIASYMIMTQTSLDELNSRLENPVTEYHFRPNIMVKGTSKPYEEDDWDWLKIGDTTVLRTFKFCTRCIITTVNPETATRNPNFEPLKTLRKYRLAKDPKIRAVEKESPVMGMLLGLHTTGKIKIGDPVYVNDK